MSAIASFILLPKAALNGLREAAVPQKRMFGTANDTYWDFLSVNGRELADYQGSGYVLGTLLCWLKDKHGADLMESPYEELATFLSESREATHFVFSIEHRDAYLQRLDRSGVSTESLCDYYNEFNETDEPDIGTPMLDGLRALRDALSQVDQNSVLLLIIG